MTERELYFVEREFAVGVDQMWSAWTTATELEQWYHPRFSPLFRGPSRPNRLSVVVGLSRSMSR